MKETVLNTIKKYSLIEKGDCVTVALSGGADSVALLHLLNELKDELSFTLRAAHLNHQIRGDEALRDEEFVKRECQRLGIELTVKRADIPKIAKEQSLSLETAARKERYAFFREASNGGKVATAHTSSDNLETVIFNLSRGSGISGLCGIPVKRDEFIRPLLFCTRAQIEDFCSKNSLSFVTDSTNLSDEYTRNKIRHNVIPVLKELNPNAEGTVVRNCMNLREDLSFLEGKAKEYLKNNLLDGKLDLQNFFQLDNVIKKRVVRAFLKDQKGSLSLDNVHIDAVLSVIDTGGEVCLPENTRVTVFKHKLFIKMQPSKREYSVELTDRDIGFTENTDKVNNLLLNNSLDCDRIVGKCVIRTKETGDSIRLRESKFTKPLKKLYNEKEIPKEERDTLPVISDDEGVIWAYGIGVADRCALKSGTKRIKVIEVKCREC